MNPRFYTFYVILAIVLFMVSVATYAIVTTPNGGLPRHLHCVQWVSGPTPVYACSDGHGYAVDHGKLVDLGPASATPYLPGR